MTRKGEFREIYQIMSDLYEWEKKIRDDFKETFL